VRCPADREHRPNFLADVRSAVSISGGAPRSAADRRSTAVPRSAAYPCRRLLVRRFAVATCEGGSLRASEPGEGSIPIAPAGCQSISFKTGAPVLHSLARRRAHRCQQISTAPVRVVHSWGARAMGSVPPWPRPRSQGTGAAIVPGGDAGNRTRVRKERPPNVSRRSRATGSRVRATRPTERRRTPADGLSRSLSASRPRHVD